MTPGSTNQTAHQPVTIGVGLLGCGNVGAALAEILASDAEMIAERTGIRFEIRKIAVRDASKDRGLKVSDGVLVDDAGSVVSDPTVDVVVELIGGVDGARSLITQALDAGKPVVTANKELIAAAGAELSQIADSKGVDLLYEAAVGGGIPLVRALRESLAGEPIRRAIGIVNGTTNYILTRMTEEGAEYKAALVEAQSLGFAEADPTADVEGFDAAAKAAIIANVAFGAQVAAGDVYREGISNITAEDIELAGHLGFVVKLLAMVEQGPDQQVGVRVHPTMVPKDHPLASVRLAFNALFVEGESVGELMFYGRGAGGNPTASAVLGDLIAASHNFVSKTAGWRRPIRSVGLWPIDDQSSAFYLAINVADQPGVLSAVAGVFGDNDVSIKSMEQVGLGDEARLIFITHTAREKDLQFTLTQLHGLDAVLHVGNVVRVIEPTGI